jgi:ketosteroid isomerase-like protein
MSRENVELVRESVRAFKRRDVPASLTAYSPEVEWRTAEDEPDPNTYRGFEGLAALVEDWSQMWENNFFEAAETEEFIDAGDFVVVPVRALVRGKASDVEVEILETYVFRVENGQITEVREFRTRAQGLQAVGLSE